MRFLEHLLQEGLARKRPKNVRGLTSREVEIMTNLVAKAIVAALAEDWKFDREDLDAPEDLISDGIMQMADGILESNYDMLWNAVEAEVKKFR